MPADSYATGAALALLIIAGFIAASWWRERQQARLRMAKIVGDRLLGGPAPVQGFAQSVKAPSLWDAIYERLMPTASWPIDVHDKRTFLRLDTRVRLSLPDRVRLALTGDLRVLSTVYTDVEVKHATTLTAIEVHPFNIKE